MQRERLKSVVTVHAESNPDGGVVLKSGGKNLAFKILCFGIGRGKNTTVICLGRVTVISASSSSFARRHRVAPKHHFSLFRITRY